MFHNWLLTVRAGRTSGATPGRPPGSLVGGPNPRYSKDKCCDAAFETTGYRCFFSAFLLCSNSYAPPLGQLALKSDREFSEGWPANPWEPSTG
jgi:endoglucanase